MTDFGYTHSSEEHGPRGLVDLAVRADDAGLDFRYAQVHLWTGGLSDALRAL